MVQLGAQDYIPKDSLNADLLRRSMLYSSERQRLITDVRRLNDQLIKAQEDLRLTQMQLFQAEKLDSLGRVAASVAHEVKNPLGTLQLGVDFFSLQRSSLGERGRKMLACMQDAIERAECIIHEMLDFSRSEKLTIQPCPANEITASAVRMIAHELIERKIAISECYCGGNPLVRADRGKIEQVLINLIMNSAQAMPGGGRIEVSTRTTILEEAPREEGLREMDLMRAGDEIVSIQVRDYGHGIAPDLAHRIFEPFFTTKPPGEGTGLGLPVSKRIVELHRGRLLVHNAHPPPGVNSEIILRKENLLEHSLHDNPIPPPSHEKRAYH
jgi:signal transduction histidine kinase